MRRTSVIVSALLMPVVLVPVLLVPVHVFQIEALPEQSVLYLTRVTPGFRFALGYTHSVEGCPVWDYLRVDEQYTMITYKTEFWSSRTGLPYAAFGNEIFRAEGDHFVIENMHRPVPAIEQWVDSRYDNTIRFTDGREYKLAALAGNRLLRMSIERKRLGEYLYYITAHASR